MNFSSQILQKAVDEISQLPSIGRRSALRLALFMLKNPKSQTENLSKALHSLVNEIKYCQKCFNFSDHDVCDICSNSFRKEEVICVVEEISDVMAIESTQQFNGKYHVLGGKISPIEGVGPQNIQINSLVERIEKQEVQEIIFALSATIEGDTTMYYIFKKLQHMNMKFSTIARGIGVGDELEYADEASLARSFENRVPYQASVAE